MRWWLLVLATSIAHAAPVTRIDHAFEPTTVRAKLSVEGQRFTGHVEIDGTIAKPTTALRLHAVGLAIGKVTLWDGARYAPAIAKADDGLLVITTERPLEPGRWTIAIDYAGTPQESADLDTTIQPPREGQPSGMFRRVVDGRDYYFTQSETIYARRIFPCIDEPDRKVPWTLTLDVPALDTAFANAPLARETRLDARHVRFEFAPTRPLPSYLVAFAIGDFAVVDGGKTASGIPVRIIAPRGGEKKLAPIGAKAVSMIEQLETWTETPFPYPKLDLVAIPRLVVAMENAGLITFDDTIDEALESVIRHEIAHQWFGDLVTFAWWNDLWLAENLATLAANPSFGGIDAYVDMMKHRWSSTRPLRETLASDDELEWQVILRRANYWHPTLRVIAATVGAETMRRALASYLLDHAGGNATAEDFVAELERAAGRPIARTALEMIEGGTRDLEISPSCSAGRSSVVITSKNSSPAVSLPVCFSFGDAHARTDRCVAFSGSSMTVPTDACPSWVLPATGGAALYRTWNLDRQLGGLLGDGWSWLSDDERRMVATSIDDQDDALKVVAIQKLAMSPDRDLANLAAKLLLETRNIAPIDLRGALDAWVIRSFGAFANKRHGQAIEELLAISGEPKMSANWLDTAKNYRELADGFAEIALDVAAERDRAFALRLLTDLPKLSARLQSQAIHALSQSRWTADLLISEHGLAAQLDYRLLPTLVSGRCSVFQRDAIIALNPRLANALDVCLDRVKQADHAFRSWLAP